MPSSINWKWDTCIQTLEWSSHASNALKDKLLDEKNCCRRAMGITIALTVVPWSIATAVSLIAEPIIKGLGNILGSCSSDKCSFMRGVAYLLLATPTMCIGVAIATPFVIVGIAIQMLVLPFWAAIDPEGLKNVGKKQTVVSETISE